MAHRYRWLYRRAIANAAPGGKTSGEGLWLITNNFSTGGAQSSARRLLLSLKRRGMRVGAAVVQESPLHPTPGRRALMEAGIPVIAIPPIAQADPALALEPLLEAMDQDPASTVFFWNLIPLHKILLADALCHARVYDVSPGEMFFESLDRYFADPQPGLPYRSTGDYGNRLAGCVVKYAAEAERARAALGVPVQVIPNGVTPDDFPVAHLLQTGPGSRPLTFGTVARLNPHKRLEDLFAALRIASPQLPPWRLRIAGGMEAGFESYAAQLQASTNDLPVEWLGDVADVRPVLQELDVFLMISEPAGCPNAILEAMATGLPVLATAAGGAADLLEHGTSGWLVPPRHAPSMAEAIRELAADPARRRELGRAARDRIFHSFSLDRMTDHYERLILGPPKHSS
jgi:glycosyltransferase involved in cell wall biosynthesis